MSLFDHHDLDEQQEAFHQALKPLTRARAERPDEEESLRTERRWAASMKRAVEETVHRLRFDDGMGHFGTAAAADLADVLATQVPAWDAAAKAEDEDAYDDARERPNWSTPSARGWRRPGRCCSCHRSSPSESAGRPAPLTPRTPPALPARTP
ncbi:hypothetical protein OIM90_24060 [Streptomyces sp. AD16]|nr:hypothetical protein OIM90_24060 [Streptomyces sp. AD16]